MTTSTPSAGTVKRETLLIAIAISLIAGFLAGAAFTVYRLGPARHQGSQTETSMPPAEKQINISGEQATAIAALEAETIRDQNNGEAWAKLGNLYFDTQQAKKAIAAYGKALEHLPPSADILTDLGVMYRLDKQPQKAIESFDKATRINPRHEPARLNKGIVQLFDLGHATEAVKTWEELLAINPKAVTPSGEPLQDLITEVNKEMKSAKSGPAR